MMQTVTAGMSNSGAPKPKPPSTAARSLVKSCGPVAERIHITEPCMNSWDLEGGNVKCLHLTGLIYRTRAKNPESVTPRMQKDTKLETDSFLTFDTPKATCYDSSRKAGIDHSVYPSARITRFGLHNAGDWSGPWVDSPIMLWTPPGPSRASGTWKSWTNHQVKGAHGCCII